MLVIRDVYQDGYVHRFYHDYLSGKYQRYLLGTNELAKTIDDIVKVDGFINTYTNEDTFLDRPCLHSLDDIPSDAMVISCVISWKIKMVNKMMSAYQFRHLDHISFIKYGNLPVDVFHFSGCTEDITNNIEKYKCIYELLNDNASKNTFFNLVNYKYSGDIRYIQYYEDRREEQYFEPFLQLPPHPIFVDIGGYQGETSLKFMEKYPDYGKIFFFEPEEKNIKVAKEKLSLYQNIIFCQKGCYSKVGEIGFSENGSSSMICEDGENLILLDKMDNMVSEKMDFIKMDIEGAEGEAIKGMEKSILDYHPTLAICVYHKPNDFWKIPQQVLEIRSDYNLYMRHYSEGIDETVMFFIPA